MRRIATWPHFFKAGSADTLVFMSHDCHPVRKWKIFREGSTKAVLVPAELRAIREERDTEERSLKTCKKGIKFR
jgi:hypothetical protein